MIDLTAKQLRYIIGVINRDNSYSRYLEDVILEEKSELLHNLREAYAELTVPEPGVGRLLMEDLALTVRAANAFRNEGIVTISDLLMYTRNELMRIPNFGKLSLAQVEEELAKYGVTMP
jgi:DNA-directed RNA polymerase alpha subunit